jgi:formiminotetrahydrofolate cyclodeaminase
MAPIADPNMVSDVGTGALLAHAGAQAAAYNVRINLPHIKDEAAEAEFRDKLDGLLKECAELADAVATEVDQALDG